MATITSSAAVTVPFCTLLKPTSSAKTTTTRIPLTTPPRKKSMIKATLKDLSIALTATAVTTILAGNAMAAEVLLGTGEGGLFFVPSELSVPAGETIVFKNNDGAPHNVVFDEDEHPAGVDVSTISMADEDLLNGLGDVFSVTLTEKGTYKFYCTPHAGAGMVGQVTVM